MTMSTFIRVKLENSSPRGAKVEKATYIFILLLFGEEKSFPIGVKILGGAVQEEKPLEGTWKCLYFIAVSNNFAREYLQEAKISTLS